MIGLHRISPSICSIMSLLMGECTRSRSAADTKWSREVALSESRSGFQRDWGRLEKWGGGNLVVFSRGEGKPCPGVAGWKAAVQKNPWELWVDTIMTRSHQRSAASLAALAEVQPACGRNGPSPLLSSGDACLGSGSSWGLPRRRLEWWRDVGALSQERRRRRGDLIAAHSYLMVGSREDRAWLCS